MRLVLPGGTAYAEGAHVRPLGRPHDGPETSDNLLCPCPNDHVRFDHGAIYLTDELAVIDSGTGDEISQLRLATDHHINPDHVKFHRETFGWS